jgi:2-phosphosulfolactate phosphatase
MSDHCLNVYNLPGEVDERDLEGATVVVIDLLRATTTICWALASGASEVVPFRTIEETLAAAEKAGRDRVVLGGERGGRRIDGFDLGNSPREYTASAVRGRPVYLTTTNGTQALYHARFARRVVVAAMVNLSAVAASVRNEPRLNILCAGTNGRETLEDILTAGALAWKIYDGANTDWQINQRAQQAAMWWVDFKDSALALSSINSFNYQLAIALENTPGGRNLIDVGLGSDLVDCAQIDRLSIVPLLDVDNWSITAG